MSLLRRVFLGNVVVVLLALVALVLTPATVSSPALRKGTSVQSVLQTVAAKGPVPVRQGRFVTVQGDGSLSSQLETKVFAAKAGTVVGPLKLGDAYYVVAIRKAKAAKVPPLKKNRGNVAQQYASVQAQRAQVTAQNDLQKTWRPKTLCAKGYIVAQCSNGPAAPLLPLPPL